MTDPPATLAEFLLDRYAEDEDVVRQIAGGFDWDTRARETRSAEDRGMEWIGGERGANSYRLAIPSSRVLAECAAKRKIVELLASRAEVCEQCAAPLPLHSDECGGYPGDACRILQLLAQPYAGHSDFREEWKP